MDNIIHDIVLAITQAVSELFPISSSGHLIIISRVMHVQIDQQLLGYLHFWTALAIIVGYAKKLFEYLKTKDGWGKLICIGIATIPAALAGFLFEEKFEAVLGNLIFIAFNLIFWGIIMLFIEKINFKEVKIKEWQKYLIIGTSQIIALFPGASRSGITTMTGMSLGYKKTEAVDIAFLLGIPITLGPFVLDVLKDTENMKSFFSTDMLLSGLLTFVLGVLAICLLNKVKTKSFLKTFGFYRIALGCFVIILALISIN